MTTPLHLSLVNRAGRATLTPDLVEGLIAALERAGDAPAVVLRGAVETFCEGLSLDGIVEAPAAEVEAALGRYVDLLAAIERTARPVIALVEGAALGGGVGVLAAADLVIASPRATFALPETVIGLFPAAVFPPLARRVGVACARRLAMGTPPLDAPEALRLGLVDEVAEDLDATSRAHLKRYARLDSRSVAAVKSLAARHFCAPPAYAPDARSTFIDLLRTDATRARIRRFRAGEAPWLEEAPA